MPSNPDTFYLTAEEYRVKTTVPHLVKPLSEEEVTDVLLEAMTILDARIGEGWAPYEYDQEFIFPRMVDEDENRDPFIPRTISLATRMIADSILEKRENGVLPHEVASESSEGHSYTKHTRMVDDGFDIIPPEAKVIISKFIRVGGQWAAEDPHMVYFHRAD